MEIEKTPKPMQRNITATVDISYLHLKRGYFITVVADDRAPCVEIVRKADGTFQVCIDDETFESGVHRFKDIYGPDSLKGGL